MSQNEDEMDNSNDDKSKDDNTNNTANNTSVNNNRSTYRQKYKHAWELDNELKGWLTACKTDPYSAYCKYCQTKLHAHKKGLLAHSKSTKHKKHVANPNFPPDSMGMMMQDSFSLNDSNNGDMSDDPMMRGQKKNKNHRIFNDTWLKEPSFQQWLRKVPTNNTKALCLACRCIITAGRCELVKHTRAAKHKKAMLEGPFEEVGESDLQWLDCQSEQDHQQNSYMLNKSATNYSEHTRLSIDLPGIMVDDVLERLNKHVPLELAEKWDNVGIITKPTQPIKIYSILLTIDLTERIVEEAVKKRVQFIISYHPPIFSPIKRLNPSQWKDRAILMCIEHKITVYSPHTALDAIKGGINDWLVSSFMTNEENKIRPIHYSMDHKSTTNLEVLLTEPPDTVAQAFKDINNVTMTECPNMCGTSSTDVRVACDNKTLPEVVEQLAQHNYTQVCSRVTQLAPAPIPGIGMGRIVTFGTPLPLYEVIERTKTHLDLQYIRLALSRKHTRDTKISSIAVCAGSGSSILKGCKADVWITGEMSHHEVLDAVNSSVTVVLCEHSNTERGFLREWSQQLRSSVFEDQVMVLMSEIDRDPLRVI